MSKEGENHKERVGVWADLKGYLSIAVTSRCILPTVETSAFVKDASTEESINRRYISKEGRTVKAERIGNGNAITNKKEDHRE